MQFPPSIKVLETLSRCNNFTQPQDILHATIWMPRICENKWYYSWVKEMLTKMTQASSLDYDVEKLTWICLWNLSQLIVYKLLMPLMVLL